MWIFTNIYVEEEDRVVYGVGYIVNSNGNFKEVIRTESILSAIKLTNVLNGGNATDEEITQLITLKS